MSVQFVHACGGSTHNDVLNDETTSQSLRLPCRFLALGLIILCDGRKGEFSSVLTSHNEGGAAKQQSCSDGDEVATAQAKIKRES